MKCEIQTLDFGEERDGAGAERSCSDGIRGCAVVKMVSVQMAEEFSH